MAYRTSHVVMTAGPVNSDGKYYPRYAPNLKPGTAAQLAAAATDSTFASAQFSGSGSADAISVSGTTFVNGSGSPIQLMGFNASGMEDSTMQGFNPWGDDGGVPDYAGMAAWGANFVRLPVCVNAILGQTICPTASVAITFTAIPAGSSTGGNLSTAWTLATGYYPICGSNLNWGGNFTNGSIVVTWTSLAYAPGSASANAVNWGAARNADVFGTALSSLDQAIASAQQNGLTPMVDAHWGGQLITIGGVSNYIANVYQQPMADHNYLAFWTLIANRYGTQATPQVVNGYTLNNEKILFGLFNEPHMDSFGGPIFTGINGTGTSLTANAALLTSGYAAEVENQSQGGTNFGVVAQWQTASYNDMIAAVRATGALNPCGVGGNNYMGQLSYWETATPTDSTNQIFYEWHAYPNASTYANETANPFPSDGTTATDAGTVANYNPANALLAAGKCIFITEFGGWGGTSCTNGEPAMTNLLNWIFAQTHPVSNAAWQYNAYRASGTTSEQFYLNVYNSGSSGAYSPILGCGTVLKPRMLARA